MPSNASGGGAGTQTSSADYTKTIKEPWAEVLTGLGTATTVGSFNYAGITVLEALEDAQSTVGGSPYELIEAYNPDQPLAAIQERYDKYAVLADDLDEDIDLEEAFTKAIAEYDNRIAESTQVAAVTTTFENRTKGRFLRQVSQAMVGLQDVQGVMTTQTGMMLANMEADRAIEVNDFDAKLELFEQRQRADAILKIADKYLEAKARRIATAQLATQLQYDVSRNQIQTKQDQIDIDLDYEIKDATWDLELMPYFGNFLANLNGAAVVPRPQTKRERLAASVMSSVSTGLQAGSAFGNPLAGAGIGLLSLATSLYALE